MAGSGGDQIIPDCGRMHTLSVKKGCWPSLSAFLGCRPCTSTSMGTLLLFASARRYPVSGLPTTLGSSSWVHCILSLVQYISASTGRDGDQLYCSYCTITSPPEQNSELKIASEPRPPRYECWYCPHCQVDAS